MEAIQVEEQWALLSSADRRSAEGRCLHVRLLFLRRSAWLTNYRLLLRHIAQLRLHASHLLASQLTVKGTEEETESLTGLGELSSLSGSLRQAVSKWPRLEGTHLELVAESGQATVYQPHHRSHALRFGRDCQQTLTILLRCLHEGTKIFGQLPAAQLSLPFLGEYVDAVSNLNHSQRELYRLFSPYGLRPCPGEKQLSLASFFQSVAAADAHKLAEKVMVQLRRHLSSQKNGQQPTSPEQTSDYFSSSSSIRTDETLLDTVTGVPKKRPRPGLEKDLSIVYTRFLEERYSVFMSLLDQAASHSELCKREMSSQARTRSVSFLDTQVKRRRRKLWRVYVTDVWEAYQQILIRLWSFGAGGIRPMVPTLFGQCEE